MRKLTTIDSLTDKNTWHSYIPIYERLFEPLRSSAIEVLEIGVDGGGSLLMWADYFKQANILGIDINPAPPAIGSHNRISHWQGNAYSEEAMERLGPRYPRDIIIDDGSHFESDQQFFVANYAPMIAGDGLLIVEDVQKIETIANLAAMLPTGFHHVCIDLRTAKARYDDVLFVAWRK